MKLYIATPIYGGLDPFWHQCMVNVLLQPPCDIQNAHNIGDSLVARSRNVLTARFLKSECTDLLWIDSDLVFSSEQIKRLIDHDVDVVGGFYPKKQQGDLNWVCNSLDIPVEERADGLQSMKYMGTGFLRIRRSVFERMIEAGFAESYKPDHCPPESTEIEHDFWHCGVYTYADGSKRYLSEDWWFCQRCLDLGIPVYGDTKIALKHSGTVVYPLKTQEEAWQAKLRTVHEQSSESVSSAV